MVIMFICRGPRDVPSRLRANDLRYIYFKLLKKINLNIVTKK